MHRTLRFAAIPSIALALQACSGGPSGITTGSLFGSKQDAVTVAAPTETPSMRAAQVGAVSARAAKCGYNFDPARLKSGFLAAEMSQGASAQDMARIEREYDTIRAKVAATVAADPNYCDDKKTVSIKSDLGRHLAGDYSLPASQKRAVDERLLASGPRTREVLNPEFMTDRYAPRTKRVEE